MRVLVLDGNQNQAVACVRSLAKAGHEVWAGESSPWSKAGWSRYCTRTFRYPAPQENGDRFVACICQLATETSGTLILPMTEATTLPLSAQRSALLAAGARFILPAHEDVLRAFDKEQTVHLASSLGITVPETAAIACELEAQELAAKTQYPVVLKPRSSTEVSSNGAARTTGRPRYASNAQELLGIYREMSKVTPRILVQRFVDGQGTGYFALMEHGELRAEFAHRRLRDVIPTGSGSALRISIIPDPKVRCTSLELLQALRWHGVAMVEFRQTPGGQPVFMEVNGRFWNSLPLACYAGVDFPRMLAQMVERKDLETSGHFRAGVVCRWVLGDFRHLIEVWRGAPPGYPEPYPGRLQTLLEFVKPRPGTLHDNFQWLDPLPELGDWLNFMERALRKAQS